MTEHIVSCPHCEKTAIVEVPENIAGGEQFCAECPACSKTIAIEVPRVESVQPATEDSRAMKHCPFCDELILLNAIKCKHCGEFLDGRATGTIEPRQELLRKPVEPRPDVQTIQQTSKFWKGLLLVFFIVALAGAVMSPFSFSAAAFLLFVGLGGCLVARIGAWWQHG